MNSESENIPFSIANDFNQHYIDTGDFPQNYIRDDIEKERFRDMPDNDLLIKLKDTLISARSTPSMCIRSDLKSFNFCSMDPCKFDVIYMDPPWKEYSDRVKSLHPDIDIPYWTKEELKSLQLDIITDKAKPSFIFMWAGVDHLEDARDLFKHWGYRRCEDICWVKTNQRHYIKRKEKEEELRKEYALKGVCEEDIPKYLPSIASDMVAENYTHTFSLLRRSKEHCLFGIRGMVKRSTDGHLINCNVDTDIIVGEDPIYEIAEKMIEKPEEIYRIIERFCAYRKKIELFARKERNGWVSIGESLDTTWNKDVYLKWFEGPTKNLQSISNLNNYNENNLPLYMSGDLVGVCNEIEEVRPKSPVSKPKNAPENFM